MQEDWKENGLKLLLVSYFNRRTAYFYAPLIRNLEEEPITSIPCPNSSSIQISVILIISNLLVLHIRLSMFMHLYLWFVRLGRLLGKAIMEQQPLPATLCLPLRKQILTTPVTFSDLEFVDSDLYKNLNYLQQFNKGISWSH